jgi:hypothetical protein
LLTTRILITPFAIPNRLSEKTMKEIANPGRTSEFGFVA